MSERMTDLERAREMLAGYPLETAQHVIAEALAAARREGAEEMRERAAQTCSLMEDRDNFDCAAAIRALKDKP